MHRAPCAARTWRPRGTKTVGESLLGLKFKFTVATQRVLRALGLEDLLKVEAAEFGFGSRVMAEVGGRDTAPGLRNSRRPRD